MNNIHAMFLRLLATSFLVAPLAYPAYGQEAAAQPEVELSAPASAADLVEAQAILETIETSSPTVEGENDAVLVEVDESDSPAILIDPAFVDPEVGLSQENGDYVPEPVAIEEVPSLINDAVGIADFDYDVLVGDQGEWHDEHFFKPVITKLSGNALVKDEATTPDIYWAIKEYLTQDDFPLSEEEKTALLSAYFDREGELIFVTDETRHAAFETAKRDVEMQGLPKSRYEFALPTNFDPIKTMALAEIEAAAFTVKYGKDMERGIVAPNSLGSQFDIEPEGRSEPELLKAFAASEVPIEFFMALEPNDPDYATLKAELAKYEELYLAADAANIPPVPDTQTLKIGSEGEAVAILRQRLEVLGYKAEYPDVAAEAVITTIALELTQEGDPLDIPEEPVFRPEVFDAELGEALRAYQARAGLLADAVAGPQTLKTINSGPRAQMAPLLVAMERHRWGAEDRTGRQIYVNLANYMAEVRDDNVKTFETIVVIGKNEPKYKTPEFHDEMEYLVINPEWNIPWSIAVDEMLPRLQRGGGYGSTYKMLNSRGKKVNMANVNFNKYTRKTFPYRFVQESGPSNALGKVKFIFPNKHNIYLHDTPAKSLFANNYRAYSHGCVRVRDPIDLATHLMEPYYANPRASFDQIRATKKQRFVEMTTKIPVFLTYFTTYVDDTGVVRSVRDVYGRDKLVKNALAEQGVIF